jgi:type VI secretion system protein ImpM
VNAGDSRVYCLGRDTQKELKQLSQDHTTTVATQTKDGIRQKRVLTEHIGHNETVHYYAAQGRVKPGERFFVCSDGVYKLVTDNEMERIVRESADAQQTSEQLVAAAVGKGESDDVTAITISIS